MNALEDKKGEDILVLDIREVAPLADYFVICSGTSDRMLDALVDAVERAVRPSIKCGLARKALQAMVGY